MKSPREENPLPKSGTRASTAFVALAASGVTTASEPTRGPTDGPEGGRGVADPDTCARGQPHAMGVLCSSATDSGAASARRDPDTCGYRRGPKNPAESGGGPAVCGASGVHHVSERRVPYSPASRNMLGRSRIFAGDLRSTRRFSGSKQEIRWSVFIPSDVDRRWAAHRGHYHPTGEPQRGSWKFSCWEGGGVTVGSGRPAFGLASLG